MKEPLDSLGYPAALAYDVPRDRLTGLDFAIETGVPVAVVRDAIALAGLDIVGYASDESGPVRGVYLRDELAQAVYDHPALPSGVG